MFKALTDIISDIGPIFAPIFVACIGFIFYRVGTTLLELKKYGCSTGFAREVRDRLKKSDILVKKIQSGQVEELDRRNLLKLIFPNQEKHLLFSGLLVRFFSRPVQSLEGQPSLQSLSDEFAIVSRIKRGITGIKCVSALLPAVGLCGTLTGMFGAFTGTDFEDPDMQNVMTGLMMSFGTALWTTIAAIVIKIMADLWCHFGPQKQLSIMTDELVQLKYYVFDIVELPTKPVQVVAKETGAVHEESLDSCNINQDA